MKAVLGEWQGRTLVGLAFSLALGLAARQEPWLWLLFPLVLLLLGRPVRWLLGGVFLLIGVSLAPSLPTRFVQEFSGIADQFIVISAPRPSYSGERCIVSDGQRRLVLQYSTRFNIAYGDTVFVRGSLGPLSKSGFEYWKYQGVSGQLRASEIRVMRPGPMVGSWGQSLRRNFVSFTHRHLSGDRAAIVKALCFNHDTELSQELKDDLRRSGTIHVISTSGLHVMIVAAVLTLILRVLPIPRWMQIGVLVLILCVYAAAAGIRPPMVRSVAMVLPMVVAYLFRRESDGLSVVAFSAILTMLWMPYAVWDIGFQLSFTSVLGLVLFGPRQWQSSGSVMGYIGLRVRDLAWASAVATVATAPLLAYHFGRFSIMGIVGNLAVAPVVGVITVGSLGAWAIEGLLPGPAGLIMRAMDALAAYLQVAVKLCGDVPFAEVSTVSFPPAWIWVIYMLGFSLWRSEKRPADAEPLPTL